MNQTNNVTSATNVKNDDNNKVITVNLEKLRELIQVNTTDKRFREVKFIIGSIVERLHCAMYHYEEYRHIMDQERNIKEHFEYLFDEDNKYYREKIAMVANVLSFMQSIHVVHDILAHLISYTLNIHFDDERYISLYNVHNKIKEKAEFSSIDSLLQKLIDNNDFKYIAANVNHSKHKYNISPSRYVDLRTKPIMTCSFSPFVYKNVEYEKRDVDVFFNSEFKREERIIITIENTIIDILEKRQESGE